MAQATAGRINAGRAFVEIVADKANLLKGLKSVQRDIKAFGQSLKDMGSDMFILGGFSSVPLLKSIKMFADFDDRLRTLKGVSEASEETMQTLKETIMELGATTAFTANQVADGAIELARIGFEADEVKEAIKPTLDLVRATGESVNKLGEYASYASSVLKIFKKNASDFNNVTNIMAFSANRSALSIQDYYESMKMAGPYAQMVGESIEGASSALMLMANMGVRGSLAGTSLRNVYQVLAAAAGKLTNVTNEENEAIATNLDALENLGVKLKDSKGNLLSVAKIMDDIKNKLRTIPKNDKLNFLIEQFGLRGSLGASSMLNDYEDYFQKQEQAILKLKKSYEQYKNEIAKHQEAGAGGFLRGLISRWEAIQITVGEGFWETIKNASQAILGFVSGVLKFIQENKKLVSSIVFATGSIFTLGIAIFGVGMIIKIFGAAMGFVLVPLSVFTKTIFTSVKAIYLLYRGLRILTNFTPKAFSISLLWLKKYYDKAKNVAKISFAGISKGFTYAIIGFQKTVAVLDTVKKALNQTYNSTSAFIKQFMNLSVQVIKQFSALSGRIISFSKSAISAFVSCAIAYGKAFNITRTQFAIITFKKFANILQSTGNIGKGTSKAFMFLMANIFNLSKLFSGLNTNLALISIVFRNVNNPIIRFNKFLEKICLNLPILLNNLRQALIPITRIAQGFFSLGSVFDVISFKLYSFAANVNVALMSSFRHLQKYFAQFSKISLMKNSTMNFALLRAAGSRVGKVLKSLGIIVGSLGTSFTLMTLSLMNGGRLFMTTLFPAIVSLVVSFRQFKNVITEFRKLSPLMGIVAKDFSNAFLAIKQSISAYLYAFLAAAKNTKSLSNAFTILGKSISLTFSNLIKKIGSSRSAIAIMEFLRVQARQATTSFWYFAEGFKILGHNLKIYSKGVAKISYNNIRFLTSNKKLTNSLAMLKTSITRFITVMTLSTGIGASFGHTLMGALVGLASSFTGLTGVLVNFIGGFKFLKALGVQIGLTFLRIGKAIKEVALISFPFFRNGLFGVWYVLQNFYYAVASGTIAVYRFISSMLQLKVAMTGIKALYTQFLKITSLLIPRLVTLTLTIGSLTKKVLAAISSTVINGFIRVLLAVKSVTKAIFSMKNIFRVLSGLKVVFLSIKSAVVFLALAVKGLFVAFKVGAIASFLAPFLAIGGAVVAGIYVWRRYGDSIKSAFKNSKFLNDFKRDFSNAWKNIKDTGIKTFASIKTAFEIGDLAGGFRVAFAGIKDMLLEAIDPFIKRWFYLYESFYPHFGFLRDVINWMSKKIDKWVVEDSIEEKHRKEREKEFREGIEYVDQKTGEKRWAKNTALAGAMKTETAHWLIRPDKQAAKEKLLNGGKEVEDYGLLKGGLLASGNLTEEEEIFLREYKKNELRRAEELKNGIKKVQQGPDVFNKTFSAADAIKNFEKLKQETKDNFKKQLESNYSFASNTRLLREFAERFNNNAQKEYDISFESINKNKQMRKDLAKYDAMPTQTAEYEIRAAILKVNSQILAVEKEFKKTQKLAMINGHDDTVDKKEQSRMVDLIKQRGYLLNNRQELESRLSNLNQTTGQAIQEQKGANAIGGWSFAELKNSMGKSIAQKTLDANLKANDYLKKIEKNSKKDLTSLGVQYL